jgi:hypothetical protein
VIGSGATGSGSAYYGIQLLGLVSISSGGGDVRVEGTGGGNGTGTAHYGVTLAAGSNITAGGMGNVTVIGRGGNNLTGTVGGFNTGVNVSSGGSNQTPGYISSSGGNVTVQGEGGGGSSDLPSASSSASNYGVELVLGGYITAGGSGTVSVTGQGGNRSPGATGASNIGVFVSDTNGTNVTTGNRYAYISSGGGAVTVNGTGGGPLTGAGSSATNHGVQVNKGGMITAGGTGTVVVTGTGGNLSTTGTGGTNYGVNVDGGTAPNLAKITSTNGDVTVTGTGGSNGGAANYGIYLNAGGKITSDGSATTVSLTGTGGNSSGANNYGIFVTGGTSPNFSTVTSGGGVVSLNGTGGGRTNSGANYGVGVSSAGQITAGGSATLSVVGSGGNLGGTGSSNTGVIVTGGGSAITSGGGAVSITGTEGGSSTSTAIATISSGSATTATNGGALTLTGNSFSLAGPVSAGASGTVNLVPRSSGVALNLGLAADTAGGPIALTSAELNQITAGTINLGNATGGPLTVSAPIALPAGSDLNVISAAGGSLTPSATGTDVTVGAGKSLSLSTISSLNLAINGTAADSGYQRLVLVGDLSLAGRSLNLSGSYTPVGGDVFTIVSATNLSGTFAGLADGSEILFNGRRLVVAYSASSVTLTDPSPVITGAPSPATVDPGTSVSFTASATGNPAPTLQWQVSTNSGVDWNNLPSATASPYTFTPSAGDTGKQFRAVFTNTFGSATSPVALLTVNVPAVVVSAWPTATAITYGQTLASSTLSGGAASVPGSFAFTNPSTAPDLGTTTQAVTFTPSDTVTYSAVSDTVSVTVNQATPTVTTFPTATAITYGQTLTSSTLSGGAASVAGSFAFTTPTTAPDAGTAAQAVTFTPTDAVNYTAVSGTVSVLVNRAAPTVTTWPTATAITYGQTLASSTLSGGVASVAGSFAFTAPGTAPDAGTAAQAVTFTPTDTVNYSAVSGTASVLVNQATATVVLGGLTAVDDGTAKAASATTVPAGLTVALTYDLSATAPSLPGTYAVVATVSDPNYVGSASGSLVISPKGPVFSGYSASTKQNQAIVIARAKILSRASDPYGGKVALPRVFGPSAQGGAVSLVGNNVTYTPAAAFVGVDTFEVELTNPAGGITRGVVTITVTGTAQPAQNLGQLTLRDGVVDLVFLGIPGRSYVIQRSANLTSWTVLGSVTAAADGKINYTDPNPLPSSGFYRTQE